MHLRLIVLVTAACFLAGPGRQASIAAQPAEAGLAPGDHTISLQHDGRPRSYIVHVPPGGTAGRARALVLAFHGGGGEARSYQSHTGFDALADRDGIVVAYPNGTGALQRQLLTWNAGDCCGFAMNQHIDDTSFAIAVIDDIAGRTTIDRRRVFATGHSNGGMMSYRLGAERADRFAAIAPVAGSHVQNGFAPRRRLAVLDIHSVDDPRALYAGGTGPAFPGTTVRSTHAPVMASVERWRTFNGCAGTPRTADTRKGRAPGRGGAEQTATLLWWDGCAADAPVAHWRLTGVGHGWPGAKTPSAARELLIGPPTQLIVAAEEVWKFFFSWQSAVGSRQ